jgi:hypothetical protein
MNAHHPWNFDSFGQKFKQTGNQNKKKKKTISAWDKPRKLFFKFVGSLKLIFQSHLVLVIPFQVAMWC